MERRISRPAALLPGQVVPGQAAAALPGKGYLLFMVLTLLFQISGIHNSFQDERGRLNNSTPDGRICEDNNPVSIVETKKGKAEDYEVKVRKPNPCLTLELTKAYDTCSSPWSKRYEDYLSSISFSNISQHSFPRSLTTPCGIAPFRWTPTTPTPCSALRPSLSLHNLESKTFTEVLIPSIKPPDTHQVSPHNSTSPKSPLIIKQDIEEIRIRQKTALNDSKECNITTVKPINHIQGKTCKKKKILQAKPQTRKSLKSPVLRPYTSLSSLAEISENLTFLECKKEISV